MLNICWNCLTFKRILVVAPLEAINMKKLNMVTKVKNTDQKAKWQFFSLDSPFLKLHTKLLILHGLTRMNVPRRCLVVKAPDLW